MKYRQTRTMISIIAPVFRGWKPFSDTQGHVDAYFKEL